MAYDYTDLCSGRLIGQLATGATTGVTVQAETVNGNYTYAPWPTGNHKVTIKRTVENTTYTEKMLVASATQNSTTGVVTLGTLTRNISAYDGTDTTGSAATITWPSGTLIYIGWDNRDAEQTAKKDEANTFSSTQTITAPLKVTGTSSYVGIPEMTTAQRTAITPTQSCFVYDTDLSQVYKWEGGAWAAVTTGTFSNAANNTAGKVDIASATEIGAGTATDATSGAINVIPVSQTTKTSNGASDENKIPVLQADGALHINHIATGTPDGTKFVRDDGVLATPSITSTDYVKTVFSSGTSSATLSNPTTETNFGTYTYQIPANDLVAGVVYRFWLAMDTAWGAGSLTIAVRLGASGSDVVTCNVTPVASSQAQIFSGCIVGTAAAGASVTVKGSAQITHGTGSSQKIGATTSSASFATNGALDIYFSAVFSSSNGSNSVFINHGYITREFTTAA